MKLGEVASDPDTKTVTLTGGETSPATSSSGGRQPRTRYARRGAPVPLYSLEDAKRLRARILGVFEDADRDPSLVDRGALNFVIVGAGATGTEVAGAIAELIRDVMPSEYHDLAVDHAKVIMVDLGDAVLGPFSPKAHDYASKALTDYGVEIRQGHP